MIQTLERGAETLRTAVQMADADLALMYLRHLHRSLIDDPAATP